MAEVLGMPNLIAKFAALAVAPILLLGAASASSHDAATATTRPAWLFMIRIARDELYDTRKWRPADQKLGQAHFEYLEGLARSGDIAAGGLTEDVDGTGILDPDTVGIAIVYAADRSAAERIAAADPGVRGGLVRVKVQSFNFSIKGKAN